MNIILISVLVIVLVIVIAILFTSVAIIHTGEVGIVERLGNMWQRWSQVFMWCTVHLSDHRNRQHEADSAEGR